MHHDSVIALPTGAVDEDCHRSPTLPDVWQPIEQWLALHPQYHAIFRAAIDQLFYGSGPLPMSDRHYIALMAANRHRCHYLMNLHEREFERLGGDSEWLNGLTATTCRISKLDVVNRVLAHQPWSISVEHLKALTKCDAPDNWSLTELVQGVVILSHTHALCSFVQGCGDIEPSELTKQEIDAPMMRRSGNATTTTVVTSHPTTTMSLSNATGEVEELMKRMAQLNRLSTPDEEDKARRFLDINRESSAIAPATTSSTSRIATASGRPGIQFTKDMSFGYIDFAQRIDAVHAPTLKIHDFSWEDHGFSCVDELYNEISEHLDNKFHLTQELTYYTMGNHNNVDTSKYRTAIWMYIQSLYGIRHDDYDYAEVNLMLNKDMKTFIKTLCCYPDRTSNSLRSSVMIDFKLSEKVHVLLMIIEARLQAELLYFIRTMMRLNSHS